MKNVENEQNFSVQVLEMIEKLIEQQNRTLEAVKALAEEVKQLKEKS